MEPVPDPSPERRDEPLVVLGLAGLLVGIVIPMVAPATTDSLASARDDLATIALSVTCVTLALLGTLERMRRRGRWRSVLALLAVCLFALLVFEMRTVATFDWTSFEGIDGDRDRLLLPAVALVALIVVELIRRDRAPLLSTMVQAIAAIRRLAWALIGFGSWRLSSSSVASSPAAPTSAWPRASRPVSSRSS